MSAPKNPARGARNSNWKGGRSQSGPGGYISIRSLHHPRARGNGYVYEHILLAEKALGRLLPEGAEVHHFDGTRDNNGRGNLVLCGDHAYHMLLHRRQSAYDACGDPAALKCRYCKLYDRQDDMYRTTERRRGTVIGVHRDCHRAYLALHRRSA